MYSYPHLIGLSNCENLDSEHSLLNFHCLCRWITCQLMTMRHYLTWWLWRLSSLQNHLASTFSSSESIYCVVYHRFLRFWTQWVPSSFLSRNTCVQLLRTCHSNRKVFKCRLQTMCLWKRGAASTTLPPVLFALLRLNILSPDVQSDLCCEPFSSTWLLSYFNF